MFKLILSAAAAFGLIFGGAKAVDAVQKGQTDEPLQAMEQWRLQVGEPMQTDVPAENAVLVRTQEQTQLQLRDQTCDPLLELASEPTQDQQQDQDQLHLYETDPQHLYPNSGNGSGDGTCDECVPYLEPGPHGNGGSGGNNP